MADIIKLLPDNIANQIAAGEVVQRPASVVKELMENAVDAGSTNVRLIIKNAGKTLIQVIDNGCGMSETDARMSFERHATSKIRKLDDLYQIHTLGFRGEALASIAAVAEVELKTKKMGDETGTFIIADNSEIKAHEACATPDGTSIAVKNLFYNVPARKNFLKSNSIELRHIIDEFIRVSLANPEISFSLVNENDEIYHLRGGNLKQRIIGIFGKKYEETLVPVEETTDILTIRGFIGKPETARKTRGDQFFFANNRFIKNAYLNHAVSGAYEDLLPDDAYPFYTIFMQLAPSRIDINVHPTKTEIKFEDEKMIYAIMRSAIRKSLNQYHIAPSLNFDEEMSMRQPGQNTGGRDSLRTSSPSREFGFNTSPGDSVLKNRQKANQSEWDELYEVLNAAQSKPASVTSIQGGALDEEEDETNELLLDDDTRQKPVMQLHLKYIVTSIRSGLMIIHQQLAHERVLYEKYIESFESGGAHYSQRLLFPEVIQLQAADYELVKEILPEIHNLGFELEAFGKNAYMINGMPADIQAQGDVKILEKIIEDYKNTSGVDRLDKREKLARALAKNTAIKIGRSLAYDEMTRLIDELFACKLPYYSPDGRPSLMTISSDELDKKFKK
jgi:DNA mismatch repair protein MutL